MSNGYKQALQRFEDAVRAHEMIGAQHPEDHAAIEREYEQAKAALVRKLQYRALAAEQRAAGICNPTPMTSEEEDYHRRQGTIV